MINLPRNLGHYILDFLPCEDRVRFSLVSKKCNEFYKSSLAGRLGVYAQEWLKACSQVEYSVEDISYISSTSKVLFLAPFNRLKMEKFSFIKSIIEKKWTTPEKFEEAIEEINVLSLHLKSLGFQQCVENLNMQPYPNLINPLLSMIQPNLKNNMLLQTTFNSISNHS